MEQGKPSPRRADFKSRALRSSFVIAGIADLHTDVEAYAAEDHDGYGPDD